MSERDRDQGVYGISVAAELTGLGAQMLRQYEDRGLLRPHRTEGGTRRYSEADLARLRRIKELLAGGLNLAGVGMVLGLEDDNEGLRDDNETLRDDNEVLRGDNDRLERENTHLRSTRAGGADTGPDTGPDIGPDIGPDRARRPRRVS